MELSLTQKDMERVIEALLFTSSEPLSIKDLKRNFPENEDINSIINASETIKNLKTKANDEDLNKKEKKQLTEEQKEFINLRKKIQIN